MPDATGARDPIVLEGQQCVGGRILTLREPFAPGLWAEAGAMRIPALARAYEVHEVAAARA